MKRKGWIMWTLPREDMTLKKICLYLTQPEETVMGSNPCQAFPSKSNLVSLFFQEKERNGITGPYKNSNGGKSYDSNADFYKKDNAKKSIAWKCRQGQYDITIIDHNVASSLLSDIFIYKSVYWCVVVLGFVSFALKNVRWNNNAVHPLHYYFRDPQNKEDVDLLEWVQRRYKRLIQGLVFLCYGNRLEKFRMFSLEKRKVQRDLTDPSSA